MLNFVVGGGIWDWVPWWWHQTGWRGWRVAGLGVNWRKGVRGLGYSRRMISEMQRSSYFEPWAVVAMEKWSSVMGGLP